jgi:hypothetical protein
MQALVAAAVTAAALSTPLPDSPHVRTMDPMAAAALDRGRRGSRTFEGLIQQLERSRVLVYVESSTRMRSAVGGQLVFGALGADGTPFLRIRLNARADAIDLTARLAHELQHAAEVVRGGVRSEADMAQLYRVIGTEFEPSIFETRAARTVQAQVTEELFARHVPRVETACPWSGWIRSAGARLQQREEGCRARRRYDSRQPRPQWRNR